MKRRDESLPAAPLESLGVIEPSVSESPNIDLSATASSNAEDQMKHEPSIETKSSPGDSNTSTPRTTPCPPRKQSSAHVLVVDDNDINLKVCLPLSASSLPVLDPSFMTFPLLIWTKTHTV